MNTGSGIQSPAPKSLHCQARNLGKHRLFSLSAEVKFAQRRTSGHLGAVLRHGRGHTRVDGAQYFWGDFFATKN